MTNMPYLTFMTFVTHLTNFTSLLNQGLQYYNFGCN
jgi:hypothetical protein